MPPRPGRRILKWRTKTLYREWIRRFGNEKGEITLYTAVGCDVCNGTGYKGRVGLHELLVGTDTIKKNIQEHARVSEMFATAVEEGMRTLKQDGIEKVLRGSPTSTRCARSASSSACHATAARASRATNDPADLFLRLTQLNDVGVALSRETDIARLLEAILVAAKNITNADGGTLYRVTDERTLGSRSCATTRWASRWAAPPATPIPFYPIAAVRRRRHARMTSMVAAYAVHHDKIGQHRRCLQRAKASISPGPRASTRRRATARGRS